MTSLTPSAYCYRVKCVASVLRREALIRRIERCLFFKLLTFFASPDGSAAFPELSQAFVGATSWMTRLKDDRDNVIHYKSKVEVYEGDPLTFAFSNPAGKERREPRAGGGTKLVVTPIGQFLDEQLLALHLFMNEELRRAVEAHAVRVQFKFGNGRSAFRVSGPGIGRFRSSSGLN